jgi:hypothetical protein
MRNYNPMTGTGLQLTAISPNAATAGSPALMMTVNGNGFSGNPVVYWNSMPLSTNMIAANQLVAVVPAAQLAMPTMAQVFVFSNGMSSNSMSFTVKP